MKKIISAILSVMMLAAMCVPAFAVDNDVSDQDATSNTNIEILETGPYPGLKNKNALEATDIDIDEIIAGFAEEFNANEDNFSAESASKAQSIINRINTISSQNQRNAVASSYDTNKAKLREGNFIELVLDLEEGISDSRAAACVALGESAKLIANANYSSENYWDPAQHFIWAFMMTDTYSKATARTIGNNHEWGITMIPYMEDYFDDQYNSYISSGYSSSNASSQALADTITYMPGFKYDVVSICQASETFFEDFWTTDCIMDFWNNCYGRAYPAKGYTYGIDAFRASLSAGELIIGPSATHVTSTHVQDIRDWDWYSY